MKQVGLCSKVARVDKMILSFNGKDLEHGVSEVRLSIKWLIKSEKDFKIRLIQQRHSLPRCEFCVKTFIGATCQFQSRRHLKAESQGNGTGFVYAILYCSHKLGDGTKMWSRMGKRDTEPGHFKNATEYIQRHVECSTRRDMESLQLISRGSCLFWY